MMEELWAVIRKGSVRLDNNLVGIDEIERRFLSYGVMTDG